MKNLKQEMQSVGVTAYRLSKLSGVHRSTIGRILKDEDYSPTIRTWDKLMKSINELKK